ncbi:MAG: ABC transporter ATP-binding protein [Firmicutes bacterium]|nr:ABC transporter ATP-binding protein [Bacillota bacterium]
MTDALTVRNLSYRYSPDASQVLRDVSFSLSAGEMLGVVGPSGCGKSTLCLCLSGIIPHQQGGDMSGEVLLFGKDTREITLPAIATQVGIVFQDPESQLFLPVIRNELAFGPENLCREPADIARVIETVAARTGISALLPNNPNQVSGGQQQIVALAAVLAMEPKILILDEVTSQLDAAGAERIQAIIADVRRRGTAVVMVEHNLEQLRQADRVIAISSGSIEVAASYNEVLSALERYYRPRQ